MTSESRRHRLPFAIGPVVLAFLLTPVAVYGQSVRGRVIDGTSGRPVVGAEVALSTRDGKRVGTALTDSTGAFVVITSDAGEYLATADALGYQALATPLMSLGTGQTLTADFELPLDPIELEGIKVEADALNRIKDELRMFGVRPDVLGERLVGPLAIEKRVHSSNYASVLQWQSIPGMSVRLTDDLPIRQRPWTPPFACVRLVPGRSLCALAVLNGAEVSLEAAYVIPPESLGAMVVLEPDEAQLLYGTRAAGGAVLLFTKVYLAAER